VTITARGTSGHAGVPRADNAILRLGSALAAIAEYARDPAHGVSPTIVRGGTKDNVIPDHASVLLNVRTTPTQSLDEIVTELAARITEPGVEIEIVARGESAPASPESSPMFEAIASAARDIDPDIVVQPYLSAGVTDSARLRQLGVQAYGVLPFPLTPDDESRMHGVDERVPVEALGFGTRLVYETVRRIAARSH
jgi:acetylornithine deacetylase/succinyl-diaminopimelate desuccinylase-like protein